MKIDIQRKNRPFSHEFGSSCLIPGSSFVVRAFPTRLFVRDIHETTEREILLPLHGPVREFTLQQDLERGEVHVWGVAREGRFHLALLVREGIVLLRALKTPPGLLFPTTTTTLHHPQVISSERVALGSHRAQNWHSIWSEMDLEEILPILFHLSLWTPGVVVHSSIMELLRQGWEPFLRVAFGSILVPRMQDIDYQGIVENFDSCESPLHLLGAAHDFLRKGLIDIQDKTVFLLERIPSRSGRVVRVMWPNVGEYDFEWSQGRMRRMILRATHDAEIAINIAQPLRTFCIRTTRNERGTEQRLGGSVEVRAGQNYLFDKFQK